ncbi:rRNA maturation RNase YbeY [Lacticaseibacillus saniviri]|uniref:Endoribonuclease YbeY n=1 Tax=Lacticaseibacillus saniviri JCM 17471 = DSM 24301 TaxID=1293598 RepID=A0A0R2MXB9_9LACO|nr:rRNA maturation RNase YbeY [Lacticaseibacillus saniviri]KRO18181.1 metalloprotease [Lacticaseibacillus saniviri JCM 17471 = DSM 24301]MCG4282163.1 rRNA maturation RNase YbeY [Lacticaseibacillus saniviri]
MDLELFDDDHLLTADATKLVTDLVAFSGKELNLPENTEMSITIVDDDEIQRINREYRDTDRVTDVISFAIEEGEEDLIGFDDIPKNIGDLFIDPAKVAQQAEDYGHSFERELGYTVVHGFLHLNGYDHIQPEDEAKMIPLQESILTAYGLTR